MGSIARSPLKKLKAAARHWASGRAKPRRALVKVDDNVVAGMRRMGASEAAIDEVLAQAAAVEEEAAELVSADHFEVYADCWESVMFFLKVQTQWVFVLVPSGMGSRSKRSGLNYPAVESTMRMAGVKRARQGALLDDLQVIELEVLLADSEAV